MKRSSRLTGALVLVWIWAALGLAGRAVAGTYGWEGSLGPGYGNGQCPIYTGQASCTPNWNYWYQISAANKTIPSDIILAGFETSSVLRGIYLSENQSGIDYASSEGMGGWYIRSGATYCTWLQACAKGNLAFDVWFRAYA